LPKPKTPSKAVEPVKAQDEMPETPSDTLVYFHAKNQVLDYELREAQKERDFARADSVLETYGHFLQRHPEAESTIS